MALGADPGTYNLVSCHRDDKGNFVYKREVNAFLKLPLEDRFVFNMMKTAGVPLIERDKMAYALGERACSMAYTMSTLELCRPMTDGCVNPREKDAFQILSIMLHSLLDGVKKDKELLYYCVPANAINEQTDADYHSKVLEMIFKAYKSEEGFTVDPRPINEALCIVYSELSKKAYTGLGVSAGGGMVNVCYAMFGNPIFKFAIVNSGDWIDRQAAKATGESVAFINREKTKIDLGKAPSGLVERAIQTQYRLMIEHTVNGIKKGLAEAGKAVRAENPIDVVVAGGTSMPAGFPELFRETLKEAKLSIPVGEVTRPQEPLYAVARGALLAAENSR